MSETFLSQGEVADLNYSYAKIYPYIFGVELAYSFNYRENELESVKGGKFRSKTERRMKEKPQDAPKVKEKGETKGNKPKDVDNTKDENAPNK
jgi:hypothetical protein